jgi:hypothetical protein
LNNIHEIGGENKDRGDYVRNYLQLNADLRLATFNSCIAPSTLAVRGLGTPFHEGLGMLSLRIVLGFLLTKFSLDSWRLDRRNTELIHYGVDAPRHYENGVTPHRKTQAQAVIRPATENGPRRLSS